MKEQYGVTTNELFKTLKEALCLVYLIFKNVKINDKTLKKFIEAEKAERFHNII